MRKFVLAVVVLLLLSCCGGTMPMEAKVTGTMVDPDGNNCIHTRYYYTLVKYPLKDGYVDLVIEDHKPKAVGDILLVDIYTSEVEELAGLYYEKGENE